MGPLEVLSSGHRGHGRVLVNRALEAGAERVVVFGGDGTWNEAVDGFLSAPEALRAGAHLVCLPAGSGCDFARHLRLPLDPARAAAVLAGGRVRRLDAVRAEFALADGRAVRFLSNMAGVGLAADAAELVDRWGKPLGGTLSYLAAAAGLLLLTSARAYRVLLDGRDLSGRYHAVLLANTESTGGGMRTAPGADASDGLFEVLTVAEAGRLGLALRLGRLYDGSHLGLPGVDLRRGRRLELASAGPSGAPSGLNIDGEPMGSLPAAFDILPGALPVLTPP